VKATPRNTPSLGTTEKLPSENSSHLGDPCNDRNRKESDSGAGERRGGRFFYRTT
jgi:hypothetical protein